MKPAGVEQLRTEFPRHWNEYAAACAANSRVIRPLAPDVTFASAIAGTSADGGVTRVRHEEPGPIDLEFQVTLWNVLITRLTESMAQLIQMRTGCTFSRQFIESIKSIPSLRTRRLAMEAAAVRIMAGKDAGESEYEAIALALEAAHLGTGIAFNASLFTRRYSTAEIVFASQTTRIGTWLDASEPTHQKLMQAWFDWRR